MIHGIGTDIVSVARMSASFERHGERFAQRILTPPEREAFALSVDRNRFLSKRFAAKEAFGKALGTGVVVPATLHALTIDHDDLGKPFFRFSATLAEFMTARALSAHLSLSDEVEYVVAFAIIEKND